MSKNLSELSKRQGLKNNLFDKIGKLATTNGTPGTEELATLADEFLMGEANTYGTASFYDFLKEENKGKKIYLCSGSACMLANTQGDLKDGIKKHFKDDEIGQMCCLGRCHENHAFHYQGVNYSGSSIDISKVFEDGGVDGLDNYAVKSSGETILTAEFPGVDKYYELLKAAFHNDRDSLLEEIKTSKVSGRGGAGFPLGMKLDSCKQVPGEVKFIVCNADEGDPGAFTDRYLLEKQPHSVLFGMMVAGYIVGAHTGVVYIRAEYPESVTAIENAIAELKDRDLLGDNILDSGFSYNFKVIRAQGSYVCGEETALLSSIEGQRPEVRIRPPYPTQEGLFNLPTVVNNVETLAAIHYILKNGGDKYASIGTGKSSGTKLLSLDSFFNNPGVYEVEMGTPLYTVIHELGGGFRHPVKAMHIGGPLGGLVPTSKIDDLDIALESFADNGFLLGHGSILCIPEDYPLVKYLEHLFEFTAEESCGKCFPCRLGSHRGYEMLKKSYEEDYKIDSELFDDLLETLEKGSLCALGGGLPLPVKNALQYFKAELEPYFES